VIVYTGNIQKLNTDYVTKIHKYEVIVIGVSTGNLKARKAIFSVLPSGSSLSVVIVMHRYKNTDGYLEQSLDDECKIHVK
jgi:chemotaxis response regulator CheB